MKWPGPSAGLAAFTVLAVAACSSGTGTGTMQCKPCPGNYLDPNGLIGSSDQVASVRVCMDSLCRTTQYSEAERSEGRYANILGTYPPDRHRIERLEVTTFDARNKVIRVETGTSITLPTVKKTDIHSCTCTGLKFAYDSQGRRFAVTTQ